MKRVILFFAILTINICMGFAQNLKIPQKALVDLVTWFNPHMGDAYIHYPLYGTAKVSEYTVIDGKLISYIYNSKRESNGMDSYIITEENHCIQHSDSTIIVTCNFYTKGNVTGSESISSHSHTYPIVNISMINDSTIFFAKNKWKLTADECHWSNCTEVENDLWNIEVVFEKGFPVKIKRGGNILYYKYFKFDKFNNWIEREVVDDRGNSRIQSRSIEYFCEQCGGRGSLPDYKIPENIN